MAIYQTRNCICAVQWNPEDKQSLENIKALVKDNPVSAGKSTIIFSPIISSSVTALVSKNCASIPTTISLKVKETAFSVYHLRPSNLSMSLIVVLPISGTKGECNGKEIPWYRSDNA